MRLGELRKSHGMTQECVAGKLGIPLTTYRNYERGDRQTPIEVLFRLADIDGVTLDYMRGRDMSPDEHDRAQLGALFDMLNEDGRKLLLQLARLMVKSGDYLAI